MNNHEKSEQARNFVRTWAEQNEQLIKTWLNGTRSIEAVGASRAAISKDRADD